MRAALKVALEVTVNGFPVPIGVQLHSRTAAAKSDTAGFKLAEGMEVPEELAAAGFKFARQKSKLAGTIRGSFFVVKGEY